MKKLIKELILISGLTGLNIEDYVKRVLALTQAATDNPLIAPDLDPTPLIITGKANAITAMVTNRTALYTAYKAQTVSINLAKTDLTNLMNNSWAPQAQVAIKGDADLAAKLAWLIKGVVTGKAPVVVGMAADSHPIVNYVDNSNHLEHNISIINNVSGKVAVPKDAARTEVYQQIGGLTPPDDIKNMSHLGTAKTGKYKNTFDIADLNKLVYYIVVYIDKKTQKALIQSPVFSATIS